MAHFNPLFLGQSLRYPNTDAVIRQYFGEGGIRWLFREGHFSTVANSVRFLETPKGPRTRYVYISDIDILILQPDITDFHVARMADTGLPYCNVMQSSTYGRVLTGRHFSQWDAFYPQRIPEGTPVSLDRMLLTEMVRAKGHGFPRSSSEDGEYHPICGIHLSPNQISRLLVEIRNKQHFMRKAYRELCESPAWQTLFPTLGFQYRIFIEAIELAQLIVDGERRISDPESYVAQVARLRSEKADRDQQVVRLRSEKTDRDQQIARLRLEKADRDQQIARLRSEKADRDRYIQHLLARPWWRRVWSAE